MKFRTALTMVLAAGLCQSALADDTSAEEVPAGTAEASSATESDAVHRGLYLILDPGVFMTFGGKSTLTGVPANKVVSNAQPYVAITLGYDLVTMPVFNFGMGLIVGAGFSGGAGRITDAQAAQLGVDAVRFLPNDFVVFEVGGKVNFAWMVASRVALNLNAHGGVAFVTPDPSVPANQPDTAGDAKITGTVAGCMGVEYYTVLNDFSIGLEPCAHVTFLDEPMIGLSITAPIKYTF